MEVRDGHLKLVFVRFPIFSLINLAAVLLERLHATFRPFSHRFIKKWVYVVIITVIWLTTAGIQATEQLQVLQTLTYFQIHMVYFSYVIVHLFVICVSYTCIFIKVRCSGHPQHHGAAGVRERKLTSTPFCCDYYIFIDLVFTCCERNSVGFSYPGILQPFLAVKVSY